MEETVWWYICLISSVEWVLYEWPEWVRMPFRVSFDEF